MNAQIEEDKINHLGAGTVIGFAGNGATYLLLTKTTNLKPSACKAVSFISGVGLSILAGHLKESYDMNNKGFYNKKDLQYTTLGGVIGSLSMTFSIGRSIPENRINKDIFNISDDPLAKK